MPSIPFWSKNEDELREQIIDMTTSIEALNAEAHEIFKWKLENLTQFEELYRELYEGASDEVRNDPLILEAQNAIIPELQFLDSQSKRLIDKETSFLSRNGLYPMLIDVTCDMILNYNIINSQINYLNK